jgi:hypothetical protein
MAGDGTLTTNDLFILVPWLLFAASVGIIVLAVRRRRPPCPNAKPARTTDKSPETRTYSAKPKKSAETAQYGDGQHAAVHQPSADHHQRPSADHDQHPSADHHQHPSADHHQHPSADHHQHPSADHRGQQAADGEDRGERVAGGENRSELTAGGEDRESENHQSQG